VRLRLFALGAGMLLASAGCSTERTAEAAAAPAPPPAPAELPASSAGGSCVLLDYAILEKQLGVRFDVAAAGRAGNTSTCVVQSVGAQLPDLSLSVLDPIDADAKLFTTHLVPDEATGVKKLGRAAYRLVSPAARGHGPVAEVGWLSADRQVLTLRFTFAAGAPAADATDMAGRMVALARGLGGGTT
jgi:hypothetical protein